MTKTLNIARYHLYLTRAIAVLVAICALSVFLYGTFLLLAVEHAAAATAAQNTTETLAAHIGDLEAQYLTATRAITPDTATELGFVTPSPSVVSTVFATASYNALSLRVTSSN
jgi:hypothetical protein